MNEFLKIGLGFERLLFFLLIFIVLCHVLTCIWVIAAQFKYDGDDSWMDDYEDQNTTNLYLSSIYYTITTITTVGYGDISAENSLERGVSILVMIVGVISFSFATGSLSSIL